MKPASYVTRIAIGMAVYALSLVVPRYLHINPSELTWLLPIAPLLFVAGTLIHFVTTLDEMLRRIHTEAMAFAGVATGFTGFSFLFVQDAGLTTFRPEWSFYFMWLYYAAGLVWGKWRYR